MLRTDRVLYETEEVKHVRVRVRLRLRAIEHLYQDDSAYRTFINFTSTWFITAHMYLGKVTTMPKTAHGQKTSEIEALKMDLDDSRTHIQVPSRKILYCSVFMN